MFLFHKILILLFGVAISVQAVPPVLNYAGHVAVKGEAFDGNGLFKFALVNTDGTTTYWSNDGTSMDGSEPQAYVAVSVNGGLYSILLGNTAQQGMGAIDPAIFAQHTDAKLRVWFSDGVNGFQQLSPDRPFASVPYAFNSESAKSADTANTAESANVAMAVQAGAVTSSMLASNAVTSDKLSPQIKADINATIGMNRLSTEVTEKLNQEKTTNNYNAPSVGSLLAVPSGSDAPAGYSLYQLGTPKTLVWEEKAPVSVGGWAMDGAEVLDGKIYYLSGYDGTARNIVQRFNPVANSWETLNPMSTSRVGLASAVLSGKIYAIGGTGLSSVEVFDPNTGNWTAGVSLPDKRVYSTAITNNGKIYLIGGKDGSAQNTNLVHSFDLYTNQWVNQAGMPTARHGMKLVWFENRIWAIGGSDGSKVESYDPISNSWETEASLSTVRHWPFAWVSDGRIFVGGGFTGSSHLNSIEAYNKTTREWSYIGNFPEEKSHADAVVLNDKVYVIAGTSLGVYSNKVFAADLNASLEGVYDLYRKDGDTSAGTPVVQSEYADGSVTGSKMADGAVTASKIASKTITTNELSEQILKYLKPEITSQPQASTIYAGGEGIVSFSAEGKYLTYQWKKDGVDLAGETNATLNIIDANATLHDGNYSVVVSNDFGSVESNKVEVKTSDALLNGLVGWWEFEEGSGTVAYDSSGNGNNANLSGGPTWINGKIGGGLNFDGVDDSLSVNKDFFYNQSFSFSLWVKNSLNNKEILRVGTVNQTNKNLHIGFRAEESMGLFFGFYSNDLESTFTGLAEWCVMTFTFDNESKERASYVNGDKISQDTSPSSYIGNGNLIIGKRVDDNTFLTKIVDDVRIYDRALSAEEVQALYNLGQ